jgi:hypothetical protein
MFKDDELEWLKGSPFLKSISEKKDEFKKRYDWLCSKV